MIQKTLVLIKPDARERGLTGEIISRFERVGLRIVAAKVVKVDKILASKHYPTTPEWLNKVGNNTLDDTEKYSLDVVKMMGTKDPKKIGGMVHQWNMEFLMSSPILALVFEGVHAIEVVRKLSGVTVPLLAAPGTIRGDFSSSSAISANYEKGPIQNLVHASGSPEEAEREIKLWFPDF